MNPLTTQDSNQPINKTVQYLAAAPDVVLHLAVAVAGADVHLGSQHLLDVLLPTTAIAAEKKGAQQPQQFSN